MSEEEIILENMNLIPFCIKKMNLKWNTADEYQDYYDYGLIGLIRGAKTYDASQGIKVSTYLIPCIKHEIGHHLTLKMMPKRFNPNGTDLSLNYLIESEEATEEFENLLEDPNVNVEEEIEKKLQSEIILNSLDRLKSKTTAQFVKMYYGLGNQRKHTYQEIADMFGVSREAVRQRIVHSFPALKKFIKEEERKIIVNDKKATYSNTQNETKKPKSLFDLNEFLYSELSKLSDDELLKKPENLELEIKRSKSITSLAQTIINNANTILEAQKVLKTRSDNVPNMLINSNDN